MWIFFWKSKLKILLQETTSLCKAWTCNFLRFQLRLEYESPSLTAILNTTERTCNMNFLCRKVVYIEDFCWNLSKNESSLTFPWHNKLQQSLTDLTKPKLLMNNKKNGNDSTTHRDLVANDNYILRESPYTTDIHTLLTFIAPN